MVTVTGGGLALLLSLAAAAGGCIAASALALWRWRNATDGDGRDLVSELAFAAGEPVVTVIDHAGDLVWCDHVWTKTVEYVFDNELRLVVRTCDCCGQVEHLRPASVWLTKMGITRAEIDAVGMPSMPGAAA